MAKSAFLNKIFHLAYVITRRWNMQEKDITQKIAEFCNMAVMLLFLFIAFVAFSTGLAFFFLVPGTVGYAIGITMFIVAGLLFVIGEINFFSNKKKLADY